MKGAFSLPEKAKVAFFVIPLIGYLALASYTWPQGFVPVVVIESLPILLLGCFFYVVLILFVALVLFLPIHVSTDKSAINHIFLNVRTASSSDRIPDLYIPWNEPFRQCKTYSEKGRRLGGIVALGFVLMLPSLLWYGLSTSASSGSEIIVSFVFFFYLYHFLDRATSRVATQDQKILYRCLLAFWLIVIPTLSGPSNNSKPFFQPNSIVQAALKNINLGGNVPVTVLLKSAGSTTEEISGNLLSMMAQKHGSVRAEVNSYL